MTPNITEPLITPTPENTKPFSTEDAYKLFPRKEVDEAVQYLTYRNAQVLRKDPDNDSPILYVFRHGQTKDNAQMLFSGWRDVHLTEKGIEQAEILAPKLKDKKIQMLFCSDMIRSIDTMKRAISQNSYAKNLEIHQDRRLRERSYGDWQGESKLRKHLEDPDALHQVRRGYTNSPPNGESLEDTVKRVHSFLDEILPLMKKENINVAISCHGNSIRGIRQYFEQLTNEETAEIETPLGQDYAAYAVK